MSVNDFIDSEGGWNCIKCGACCKYVFRIMPELDRGDGACIHLNRDDTCGIYAVRPELCVVPQKMIDDYPYILALACNMLKEAADA